MRGCLLLAWTLVLTSPLTAAPAPTPKRGNPSYGDTWSPVGTWVDRDGRAVCTFSPDGSYSEIWTTNGVTLAYQGRWWVEREYTADGGFGYAGWKNTVVADALRAEDYKNPGKYRLKFRRQLGRDDLVAMCSYCYRMERQK